MKCAKTTILLLFIKYSTLFCHFIEYFPLIFMAFILFLYLLWSFYSLQMAKQSHVAVSDQFYHFTIHSFFLKRHTTNHKNMHDVEDFCLTNKIKRTFPFIKNFPTSIVKYKYTYSVQFTCNTGVNGCCNTCWALYVQRGVCKS